VLLAGCLAPFFVFLCYGSCHDLHSFPTRRSSDLDEKLHVQRPCPAGSLSACRWARMSSTRASSSLLPLDTRIGLGHSPRRNPTRSEEHTSELQSRENLVCRLLLEKKKSQTWQYSP